MVWRISAQISGRLLPTTYPRTQKWTTKTESGNTTMPDMAFLATADKSWKVAIKRLTVDELALQWFLEDLHPLGLVDCRSLADFALVSRESIALPALENFCNIYGSTLQSLSIMLHFKNETLISGKQL